MYGDCFIPEDANLVTNFFQLCLEAIPCVGRLVSVGCCSERIVKTPGESCDGVGAPKFLALVSFLALGLWNLGFPLRCAHEFSAMLRRGGSTAHRCWRRFRTADASKLYLLQIGQELLVGGYRMNLLGAIVLAESEPRKSPSRPPPYSSRPVHTTAQPQHQKKHRPILHVVVRQFAAILQLFAGEDQALLVRMDALLVLDLLLHVLDVVRKLHSEQ